MRHRGFTLIEILVAITIVMMIVAAGIASYASVNARSRDAKRKSDLEQVRSALEMYRADNGYYPDDVPTSFTALSSVTSLSTALVDGAYISALPVDPKGDATPYMIRMSLVRDGHYYGYCLSAYVEAVGTGGNTCKNDDGAVTTLPSSEEKTYTYGIRQP